MGKKLFSFRKDQGADVPEGEAAAPVQHKSGHRMRELMKRDFGSDQVAVLREIEEREGAARINEAPVDIENVFGEEDDMLKMVSEQTGLRMINLHDYPRAEQRLRNMISSEQAKTLRVVPVEQRDDGVVVVAIADPSNPTIADDLRLIMGTDVETVIADEHDITSRIEDYYALGEETMEDIVEHEAREVGDEDVLTTRTGDVDLADMDAIKQQKPTIKLVNLMLTRAIKDRSSDIHIEPYPNFIRIRYRVDGVLREIPAPPKSQLQALVSRIKVMANLDIAESRLPQDGRIKLTYAGREVDLRVACVPTVHGESIAMRVLDKSMMLIGIRNIGMLDEVLDDYLRVVQRPNGIILCTGPTGSGKTTTLYATLGEILDPGMKFITTEDPVEYELPGIQQVNINEGVGLTYARSLRAILRQDPDIVLVGEIRDVETAQITVQASLTGHLVFSTLHTNSAAATITRLLDMGVEPFLITSSLEAIIGQRLVRSICQHCKKPYRPSDEELEGFGVTRQEAEEQNATFYHGDGCAECGHSGYRGRLGIYELLQINDEIRDLILERATTDEIQEAAMRNGMISMRQDGWEKVLMGLTTLSEVARQTPRDTALAQVGGGTVTAEEGPHGEITDGRDQQKSLPQPEGEGVAQHGEEASRIE